MLHVKFEKRMCHPVHLLEKVQTGSRLRLNTSKLVFAVNMTLAVDMASSPVHFRGQGLYICLFL